MYAPKYRLEAIETIGRKILLEYDRTLLEGPPQAIPIETIIETKFNLTLEYHRGTSGRGHKGCLSDLLPSGTSHQNIG